jgi:thymidylate synthase
MPLPTLQIQNAEHLKGLDGLLSFKFEHLKLENYQSWGKIAAPVAV